MSTPLKKSLLHKPTFCLRGSPLWEALGKDFANCQKWCGSVPKANPPGRRGAFTPTIPLFLRLPLPQGPWQSQKIFQRATAETFQLPFKGFLGFFSLQHCLLIIMKPILLQKAYVLTVFQKNTDKCGKGRGKIAHDHTTQR